MKNKMKLNIQFFAEPEAGGNAAETQGAGSGNGSQGNAGGTTYTYEQAEEIASARAMRAEQAALKSYFKQQGMTEEEVKQAMTDYRQKKELQKPNITAIEKERDAAIEKAKKYEEEKILSGMNVKTDDLDYVTFKVSKLVTEKKDFKTAAAEFLKENPRYASESQGTYRVSTGTQSSGKKSETTNEQINDAIRGAFRRK